MARSRSCQEISACPASYRARHISTSFQEPSSRPFSENCKRTDLLARPISEGLRAEFYTQSRRQATYLTIERRSPRLEQSYIRLQQTAWR